MAACQRQVGGKCCEGCRHREKGEEKRKVLVALSSCSSEPFRDAVRELKRSETLRQKCKFIGQDVPHRPTDIELLEWHLAEIQQCDLFVIFLENEMSKMLCATIGMAIFHKKRILVLNPHHVPLKDINLGTHGQVRGYKDLSSAEDVLRELLELPLYDASHQAAEAGGLFVPAEVAGSAAM